MSYIKIYRLRPAILPTTNDVRPIKRLPARQHNTDRRESSLYRKLWISVHCPHPLCSSAVRRYCRSPRADSRGQSQIAAWSLEGTHNALKNLGSAKPCATAVSLLIAQGVCPFSRHFAWRKRDSDPYGCSANGRHPGACVTYSAPTICSWRYRVDISISVRGHCAD